MLTKRNFGSYTTAMKSSDTRPGLIRLFLAVSRREEVRTGSGGTDEPFRITLPQDSRLGVTSPRDGFPLFDQVIGGAPRQSLHSKGRIS